MIFQLVTDLKEFLEAALGELWQRRPGKDDSWGVPQVFVGGLPDKEHDKRVFPFVVIEPFQGLDDTDRSEASIVLTCGVYSGEEDTGAGLNDVFNVLIRTRQAVLGLPGGILKQRYELKRPVRWRMDGAEREDGHPYYWGRLETVWEMPVMIPSLSEEVMHVFGLGIDFGL